MTIQSFINNTIKYFSRSGFRNLSIIYFALMILPLISYSQDEGPTPRDYVDTTISTKNAYLLYDSLYKSHIAGEFTPGKGFDLVKTDFGSLNISGYLLARYLNQLPGDEKFTDHLGRVRTIHTRNDIMVHRVFVWLTGFLGTPRFAYNLTIWGLPTTQQSLIFGNLQYSIGRGLKLGVGIGPNLGTRSLQGTWPFFNASDRQLGEESTRPGFTGSFWITGEMLPRLYYTAQVGDNLSILGVSASNLTRYLSTGVSMWWMPTTGEFGPRGGNGDMEYHTNLATRFGFSYTHARDSRFSPLKDSTTLNTQIKLSDGINLFERGALADGVTVLNANYDMGSVDMSFKYRGFFLELQYFFKYHSKFDANGPLPLTSILDQAVQVDLSHMLIPYTLNAYISGTYTFDEFERHPNELAVGLNYYPLHARTWRINAHFINVFKSSASSNFGYYVAGQTQPIFSIGTDILL
jgi:hypothetical protein